jgi:serine/threonine protein kinase
MARKFTFEQVALENGLAAEEHLKACRLLQDQQRDRGEPPAAIEDLMLQQGFMTEDKVRAVRTALARLQRDEDKGDPVRIGNYEIIHKVGDGGLGTVYKARQVTMAREVALKVLHKKWLSDEEFKKRFLLEARLAGRLSHQNLIQVYDVGLERGQYYFAMEFVSGETLDDLLEREGAMEPSRAIDITIQVLRAILYMKRYDIVHRDIKPGNIMLSRSGLVKLGDFGFVKTKLDHVLSTEGEVLGTPDYISPEQAMGVESIDWRSDQYSLGCSLYHMLTGRPPFEGSQSSVMRQHIKADLPDPRLLNPAIPQPLLHIMEKMLNKDPNDRYQKIEELFHDLEMVKIGQDPTTPQAGKSTILKQMKAEKGKAERFEGKIQSLESEIGRLRRLLVFCLAVSGVIVLALLVLVILLILRGK